MARLRVVKTTLGAIARGFAYAATRRVEPRVELKPGDPAPDFSLAGSDGRSYRLSDYAGREPVVLAWFPKAFTAGCSAECRSLRDSGRELKALNARCFGASVDDPETNRQFAESMDLDFPILSDPDRRVARAYGVLGASGFASRWTFYIGADGRIREIDRRVRPAAHGTHVAARLRELNQQGWSQL